MANEEMENGNSKYGARVYRLPGKLIVKQTVLRETSSEYVVDGQKERHVPEGDDGAIASAIRDAVQGKLAEKNTPTLDDILVKITDENIHHESDTGGPAGNEVW